MQAYVDRDRAYNGICTQLVTEDGWPITPGAGAVRTGAPLVFPSTMALVSTEADERHLGAGMGMIGTFKNAAKVTGPVAAGVLVHYVGFEGALLVMAGFVLLAPAAMWTRFRARTDGRSRGRALPATPG